MPRWRTGPANAP
jgi:hypothetical protein